LAIPLAEFGWVWSAKKIYAGKGGKMREDPGNTDCDPGKAGRYPVKTSPDPVNIHASQPPLPASGPPAYRFLLPFGERDRPGFRSRRGIGWRRFYILDFGFFASCGLLSRSPFSKHRRLHFSTRIPPVKLVRLES